MLLGDLERGLFGDLERGGLLFAGGGELERGELLLSEVGDCPGRWCSAS